MRHFSDSEVLCACPTTSPLADSLGAGINNGNSRIEEGKQLGACPPHSLASSRLPLVLLSPETGFYALSLLLVHGSPSCCLWAQTREVPGGRVAAHHCPRMLCILAPSPSLSASMYFWVDPSEKASKDGAGPSWWNQTTLILFLANSNHSRSSWQLRCGELNASWHLQVPTQEVIWV